MKLSPRQSHRDRGIASVRRPRRTVLLSIGMLLSLILGMFAAPLAAQNDGSSTNNVDFEVLSVDVRNPTGTVVVRPEAGSEPGELTVEIEGEQLVTSVSPIFRSPVSAQTIIVIDDSETAEQTVGFGTIRSAAVAFVDGLSADTRVMLVRAGGGRLETQIEVPFTGDHESVKAAINSLSPGGGAVTMNAIADSVNSFASQGDGIRNVVAFVGSPGAASSISADAVRGRLIGTNAGLTVVAPRTTNLDISEFQTIADQVRGGSVFRGVSDESDMVAAATIAASVQESYLVGTFPTDLILASTSVDGTGEDGTNELTARFGDGEQRVRILPSGVVQGAALDAPALANSSRFSVLSGNVVALIAIALIVVFVIIGTFTLMSIIVGADNTLNSTLSVYGGDDRTSEQEAADEAFNSNRSRIIEQVVERAEEAAEARGSLGSTTNLLQKAEIPLRVGEAFAVQVGLVLLAFVIGFLISGTSLIGGLFLAVPAAIVPYMYVNWKVGQRAKKIERQLPDTLTLLASTLKAGYSFLQGLDAVGNEAEEPLAGEFRRTVNEARLGKEMDEALDDLGERIESQDMLWAIVAIKIQREVGGNLAELLTIVAETMNSRQRLRGEVQALTAEGRISAYVLLALPFLVAFAMNFLNQEYLSELWTQGLGIAAVIAALVSMTVGGFWMRKIVDIEL